MGSEERAGREVSFEAAWKPCLFRADQVESFVEELLTGVVKDDDEVHPELYKRGGWEFGFNVAWILAPQVSVGLIPGRIFAGRSVQNLKFVVERA